MTVTKSDKEVGKEYIAWNARENKKPLGLYIVLILMCLILGWVLSSTGH